MNTQDIVRNLPSLLAASLVAVLFIQSGFDKISDRKGNLEWLTGHFSKTLLAGFVPILLTMITLMELGSGLLAGAGVIYFLITSSTLVIFWAAVLAAVALLSLFFGQRIAKDYPGAASIVPYFILTLILMLLTSPYARQ